MKTIRDLPVTDPCVVRMLGSMWIGDVKIDSNTVLDPEMIKSKIKMLEEAPVDNHFEAASVACSILDLRQILRYLV